MTRRALSSSFVTDVWTYHVFLSFRGVDTRFGFTNNLHQALVKKGIRSFIDHEELQVGEKISPALANAIEGSRIGIIVFSKNYASSTFCLEELVHILQQIKGKGRLVWPIFYRVDPCNVRNQIRSYKKAFDKHEKRFDSNNDKIERWKEALHTAANLKGEHFTGNEYEYDFIEKIVQQVSRIINRIPLHISANYLVDLESRVTKVISLLYGEYDEVKCMVGICGIGGIGKSTLARVVFNLIADQFEGLCFLTDVRENSISSTGLVQLQQTLLFEVLDRENITFFDVYKGSGIIKDRLKQKKVLFVLDDIDELKQLQMLAGGLDWFGPGSRIIITTRNKQLLRVHGVKRIYEVEELNDTAAIELFCWNAFKENKVCSHHLNVSKRAIRYCKGLPLALDIIGCNLFGKDIEECESALDAYEKSPDKKVQEILKVSYDGLQDNEKLIFLDIACFFKGYKLSDVNDMLSVIRDFNPKYAISVLIEKSLINIYPRPPDYIVSMHDLIQDMGREIVRQESRLNPGEWSRLWFYEDILDVLQENKGTNKIEFIMLNLPEDEEVKWDGEAFKDMKNLKALIIKNAHFSEAPKHLPNSLKILDWTSYPSSSLPQDFYPRRLVKLNMPNCVLELDKPLQGFKWLTHINLSNNRVLIQVPDVSAAPNLRILNLKECINLIEIHDSLGHHERIRELYVTGCPKLRIFPHSMKSTYLSHLDLSGCLILPSFPKFVANDLCVSVGDDRFHCSSLYMEVKGFLNFAWLNTGISFFSKLGRLTSGNEGSPKFLKLSIKNCSRIDEVLTTNFSWFHGVEELLIENCELTNKFLSIWLLWFPNLTELDLTASNFSTLPACISQCCFLRRLVLDRCYQLRRITKIPSSIKHLSAFDCTSLTLKSLNLLSSEKLHEGGGTYLVMPGSSIPTWFHHRCKGSLLSFWFRERIPLVALCLVLSTDSCGVFAIHVHVNGHEILSRSFLGKMDISDNHVYLFDLRNRFQSLWSDEEDMKQYIEDGWNYVEFKIDFPSRLPDFPSRLPKEAWMGVYAYKENYDKDQRSDSKILQLDLDE